MKGWKDEKARKIIGQNFWAGSYRKMDIQVVKTDSLRQGRNWESAQRGQIWRKSFRHWSTKDSISNRMAMRYSSRKSPYEVYAHLFSNARMLRGGQIYYAVGARGQCRKLRQRMETMKFIQGLMIESGDLINKYVTTATRHVLQKQGMYWGEFLKWFWIHISLLYISFSLTVSSMNRIQPIEQSKICINI